MSEAFNLLFIERTHHVPIIVGSGNTRSGSRIGGNAPSFFDASPPVCPYCGCVLKYYLTLFHEGLLSDTQEISVFYCPDFKCLLRSRHLKDEPSLIVIGHPESPRSSSNEEHHSDIEERSLEYGSISKDINEYDEPVQGAKVGGEAGLVQGLDVVGNVDKLGQKDFLFQFDEEIIPEDMSYGTLTFASGMFYVFADVDVSSASVNMSEFLAFWQSL